eukprot:TRINITY_DN2645_c0_g1_i1.p1 TRINITY_DN2645_c0_g1~~TRINITY_DN2645_c0_g1_i1.p1  ORF type:complete len:710 (-),score=35.40 TRINITY_DN2645_c0_g1_i1:357-2294(-)
MLFTVTFVLFQISIVSAQIAGCPAGCLDEQPPNSPHSCQTIANVFKQCSTRVTSGDRYCKCSCKTCPGQQSTQPSPSPAPTQDTDGWFFIDQPTSPNPSPSPVPLPTPTPQFISTPVPAQQISGQPLLPAASLQQVSGTGSNLVSGLSAGPIGSTVEKPTLTQGGDTAQQQLALTVGGSRGVSAFRRDIENNIQPSVDDITFEGIFAEYFFDFSQPKSKKVCTQLFCAKYSVAVSEDPLYSQGFSDLYLAIGLESGTKIKDFKRKDLDLVIVLDISGSMRGTFGSFEGQKPSEKNLKKIDVAKTAIKNVMKHLTTKDRLGIVTFERTAKILQGLKYVTSSMKLQTAGLVNQISAGGTTNLEAGLRTAARMMTKDSRQNRMIVITDANANAGEYRPESLATLVREYSLRTDPIFTTLIGVGLDFNSALTRVMLQTRGANYFSVYSPSALREKLDEEFEFIVSPFIFDLRVEVDAASLSGTDGWFILEAFGVPEPQGGVTVTDKSTILQVSTLFPTPSSSEGSKGGIILLSVFPKSNTPRPLKLSLSYKDTDFNSYGFTSTVNQFKDFSNERYGTIAIRKAIVLSRYVQLLQNWLQDVKASKLTVPQKVGNDFIRFINYLLDENKVIKDPQLDEEVTLLKKLVAQTL